MWRFFQSGTVHRQKDEFLNTAPSIPFGDRNACEIGWREWAAPVAPERVDLYLPLTVPVSVACSFEAATQRRNAAMPSQALCSQPLILGWRSGANLRAHPLQPTSEG